MAISSIIGTLGADNAVVAIDTGENTAFSAVVTGAFVGTITFQVLFDQTEGWVSAQAFTRAGVGGTATLTAAGNRILNVATALAVRAIIHPYVSGSPVVTLAGSSAISVGAASGGGGGATTIADGADVAQGSTTDAGIITDTNGTAIGFLRGAIKMWLNFLARFPAALGGTTAAASLPVALSSDGTFATLTGAVNETAPATDTASSGLNGRAQRIAQRITSLITALGSPFQAGGSIGNTGFTAVGTVAHGTANSGAPITEGRVAIAHGTNPTAVAAAARTDMYANRAGVPFVMGGHPNIQTYAQNFTSAQTDTALVTVAGGLKVVVTGFVITASNANTVNVSCRLGFGTANVPAYNSAGLIGTHPGIAPGSGFGRGGGAGIIGVGADGEDLRLTISVPTGGSVDAMVSFYTIES